MTISDERDDALLRAERAEDQLHDRQAELLALQDRVTTAEAMVVNLSHSNGWFYRKWHTAEDELKRLRKVAPFELPRHGGRRK